MLSSFLWGSLLTWVTEARGARGGERGDLTAPAENREPWDAAESALLLLLLLGRPGFSPEPSSSVVVLAGSCRRPGQNAACYLWLSDLFPWVLEFVLITPVVSRCVDHTFSRLVLGSTVPEVVEKTHKNACFSGVLNACPAVWGDGSGLLGPM